MQLALQLLELRSDKQQIFFLVGCTHAREPYNYQAHQTINGFCMLAAGAALQVQLFALSACLHKQTLVISERECHKGVLLLADGCQPTMGGGAGGAWGGGTHGRTLAQGNT